MAKTSGIARGTNPAGVGAGIASERLKNSVAIPNQHDVNAKLYKELSGSFQAKGDRPRGLFANAASGFFLGMEHAENSKSTAKKTEKAEQYDKVMGYLEEVNNSTIERNEWFEKQEYARKQTLPSVLAYMNNIDKLDPQSQFLMAQNILTQYSSATGEPLKLVSIGGSNPNMVTVEGEKGVSVLDLSTLFAGNDALDEQIAHKSVDYQLALQEKRADKEREFALKEEKVAMEREFLPEKYSVQREKLEETRRRNDQADTKSDIKLNETLGKKIDSSREFLTIAPKMEKIVIDHPDIFQSAIDAVWRESKEPGFIANMTKDAQAKFNPEKVKALTTMVKYINKMTLDVANGFARPNMFIEKIGSKAVPNLDMNPEGFMEVLKEMVEENKTSIRNNTERVKLLERERGGLSGQYEQSTQGVMAEGGSEGDPFASRWKRVQ